jgi:YfiH family protein
MRLIHGNGVSCFQFPQWVERSVFFHGVFLRQAVNGRGTADSFNLGLGHDTSEAQVWRNRENMLGFFGSDYTGVYGRQVHGKEVGVIRDHERQQGRESTSSIQINGDALITDVEGLALVIQVADCQPILIIDPVKRVVANIHSGWRGSIQNIIGTTVHRMETDFKCRPKDLICGIGPSLGPCCAEFINFQNEIPEPFWKYRWSEYLFDFWQASMDQLTAAGVRSEKISLSGLCTRCNRHLFFSYRAERQTGRFAAVVGIRPGQGDGA